MTYNVNNISTEKYWYIYLWWLFEDFPLLVGVLDGVNELLFIKAVGLCFFILLIICCCLRLFIFCFPAILIDLVILTVSKIFPEEFVTVQFAHNVF